MMKSILSPSIHKLAIVGLAKNVGKTTTLNWIIEEGQNLELRLGLASIGVDGEKQDVWDLHQKPTIKIKEGMWAASAKAALQDCTARFRIVEEVKPTSPMGPVYLLECIREGDVKLAGTQTMKDIRSVWARFEQQGVSLSIVDGAYDRLASAQKEIAQGFILCTGAALDPNLEIAANKTEEILLRWQLPEWKGTIDGGASKQTFSSGTVAYICDGEWVQTESASLLSVLDSLRLKVAEGIDALYIPGALTEWVIQHFSKSRKPFTWIVDDPTKLFLSKETMMRWFRLGGQIYVRQKSELLALSVNPYSIEGEQDSDRWLYRMKEVAGEILVMDALRHKII
jgi:hypothetical protein